MLNIHQGETSLLGEFKSSRPIGWWAGGKGSRNQFVTYSWNDSWQIGNTDLDPFDERSSPFLGDRSLFFPGRVRRSLGDRYSVHVPVQTEIQSDRTLRRIFAPTWPRLLSPWVFLFLFGWPCCVWHWTCIVLIKYQPLLRPGIRLISKNTPHALTALQWSSFENSIQYHQAISFRNAMAAG